MELAYTNYTNVDTGFVRPYERGDRLVRGHAGISTSRWATTSRRSRSGCSPATP
jgi:hypothetical protein